MATKKKTAKTTKKFELSRAQLSERLGLIIERLSEIDVHDLSPTPSARTLGPSVRTWRTSSAT